IRFHQADLSILDSPLKDLVRDTRQQIGVRSRGESQAISFVPGDWVRLNTDAPDYEPWQVVAVDDERNLLSLTQSALPEGVSIERPTTDVIAKVDSRRAYQPRLQQLHQVLIAPIAEYLPTDPNAHVIFIPHRELFLVPFAALQDTEGNYLIEKHTILTAPAIQVLDLTRQQRQQLGNRQPGTGSKAFLIVGNPTMPEVTLEPENSPQPLAPLPSAELEAQAIAQVWEAQPLIGDQASEAEVVANMPQSRIIHLATHGLLDEVRGLDSALALAPSENRDGLLTAEEILGLNLQAELVVLSACNTGRGRITGDGVIGLSRSFISAGVPSLVVSLWMVRDAPTAALMTEFYQNLRETNDKAQALRQAMLKMIKDSPNPKNWAAFTLIGEAE
ncbi:MAG: CHAT domain-containing protein, partial [Leptolyngbyaceae cyanobacterium MO_188.B28]|nr:CHAT domain-containing protein [Leptolyngbyaceae cyanobacterium MO_188.B28]